MQLQLLALRSLSPPIRGHEGRGNYDSAKYAVVVQLARASAFRAECCEFDSRLLLQILIVIGIRSMLMLLIYATQGYGKQPIAEDV